jgi:enamine deaminase RidA (YjgF/YER057c/UK114 family)
MTVEDTLAGMGISLQEPTAPAASYIPAVQVGNLLFVSGNTGSRLHDIRGKVGRDVTVEQGYEAAKWTMVSLLAVVKQALGDLERVERVVKLLGFINAPDGFTDTPAVLNGASDLLIELYGDKGKHARSAIGVPALPGNAPVEVEMIVQVK